MSVKKYTAATTREALSMVRDELGDEAVILSNRKVKGGIEIMAMTNEALSGITKIHTQPDFSENDFADLEPDFSHLDRAESEYRQSIVKRPILAHPGLGDVPQLSDKAEPGLQSGRFREPISSARKAAPARKQEEPVARATASKAPSYRNAEPSRPVTPVSVTPEQQYLVQEIKSIRSMLQEQFACMAWSDMQQRDPKRTRLLRDMVNAGFSPALTRQLLDKMPADADMSWVHQVLAHNIHVVSQEDDVVARGGIYALTGPTGVGKTTTTAKLAARAVVRYGADSVALVTTDSYRIGAHEQLRIYGKILGVSVHAARDTGDLRVTLSGLKHKRLVLIDTMGMGQRDKRLTEQAEMFDAVGVKRLILLNATSSGQTLEDVVRMYHGKGVIGCIATKLDEAVTLGGVLDVMVRHKLMLHYVANGQRVPEDFHEVNMAYLLHRAFEPAGRPAVFATQELDIPALMAGQAALNSKRGYASAGTGYAV